MNHNRLQGTAIYLGEATTLKKYAMYPDVSYMFPYVIKEELLQIQGELYSVGDELLDVLDIFEGTPRYYKREKIAITINNITLESWIYFKSNNNKKQCDKSKLLNKWTKELEV